MMRFAADQKYEFKILAAVENVNATQKTHALRQDAEAFRQPQGQDDRRLGPRVQTQDRRHARGAVDSADRVAARLPVPRSRPTIPRPTKVAKGIFGDKVTFTASNYDALKGADALAIVTEWNEFRRPDFARMKSLMRIAGRLRRTQPVHAGADEAARLHLLLHWPQLTAASSWSPAAPATSAVMPPRRSVGAGYQTVIYDDLSAGHREATLGAPLIQGDIRDVDAVRRALREYRRGRPSMHFAAWLAVPDSVGDPIGYYRNNVAGTLGTLEAMAAEKVSPRSCSRRPARSTASRWKRRLRETHPTAPINAYGQTKLASSRRCRTTSAPTGSGRSGCGISMPPAPIPTGSWARTMRRKSTSFRGRSRRRLAAPPLDLFGEDYPTPDGTCLRDYIHVTDLADAHVRALARLEGGASATYNVGTERPSSVREVIAAVERVTGRHRESSRRLGARGPGRAVRVGSARSARILAGSRSIRISIRSWRTPGAGIRRTLTATTIGVCESLSEKANRWDRRGAEGRGVGCCARTRSSFVSTSIKAAKCRGEDCR